MADIIWYPEVELQSLVGTTHVFDAARQECQQVVVCNPEWLDCEDSSQEGLLVFRLEVCTLCFLYNITRRDMTNSEQMCEVPDCRSCVEL